MISSIRHTANSGRKTHKKVKIKGINVIINTHKLKFYAVPRITLHLPLFA